MIFLLNSRQLWSSRGSWDRFRPPGSLWPGFSTDLDHRIGNLCRSDLDHRIGSPSRSMGRQAPQWETLWNGNMPFSIALLLVRPDFSRCFLCISDFLDKYTSRLKKKKSLTLPVSFFFPPFETLYTWLVWNLWESSCLSPLGAEMISVSNLSHLSPLIWQPFTTIQQASTSKIILSWFAENHQLGKICSLCFQCYPEFLYHLLL